MSPKPTLQLNRNIRKRTLTQPWSSRSRRSARRQPPSENARGIKQNYEMAWSSKEVRRQLVERRVQLSPSLKRGGEWVRILVYSHLKNHHYCNRVFKKLQKLLLQYTLSFLSENVYASVKHKNFQDTPGNIKTLVCSLIRPKNRKKIIILQTHKDTRIILETTARRRKVKIRR